MSYFKIINDHMKNKFSNFDNIEELETLPDTAQLYEMSNNKLYKCAFSSVAVDIVNFKKLSEHTDPEILNIIMSEFIYGVTKIMREYGAVDIDIQGDRVFCTLRSSKKEQINNSFNLACSLNTFKKHINKMISKQEFSEDLKDDDNDWYGSNVSELNFGIGVYFSFENYISKVGFGKTRKLIYMGEAVNGSNALAKLAGRNGEKEILINGLTYANFTDKEIERIDSIDGVVISSVTLFNDDVYGANWIISNYDNFVENNV